MKNKNWFWGLFLLLLAAFIILSQTQFFSDINIVSILATVLLTVLIVSSLPKRDYFCTFVPLSLIYMMYSKQFKLMYISPWLLILSAVLVSAGFSMLFPRQHKKAPVFHDTTVQINRNKENNYDNNVYAKVALTSSSKYLHSECLQSGQFISYIGVLEVYFDQAQPSIDGAEVFIDNIIGSIYLYIPRHWNVVNNIDLYLGDLSYSAENTKLSENAPRLKLSGRVILGNVKIIYI